MKSLEVERKATSNQGFKEGMTGKKISELVLEEYKSLQGKRQVQAKGNSRMRDTEYKSCIVLR